MKKKEQLPSPNKKWNFVFFKKKLLKPEKSHISLSIPPPVFLEAIHKWWFFHTFLASLKNGDRVYTNSGIIGTIRGLDETTVLLEVEDHTEFKMLRSAIQGTYQASSAK